MEIRLRGVLCVPHGSKEPQLDGNRQRAAGDLVDQLLQVTDLGTGTQIEAEEEDYRVRQAKFANAQAEAYDAKENAMEKPT